MTGNNSVTLKDVYTIVERLEEKLDDRFVDHENRIRVIEKFMNKSAAIVSAAMLFASAFVSFITNRLTGK